MPPTSAISRACVSYALVSQFMKVRVFRRVSKRCYINNWSDITDICFSSFIFDKPNNDKKIISSWTEVTDISQRPIRRSPTPQLVLFSFIYYCYPLLTRKDCIFLMLTYSFTSERLLYKFDGWSLFDFFLNFYKEYTFT